MDPEVFDSIQSSTRESTIQVNGLVAQKRLLQWQKENLYPPEYEVNVTSGEILVKQHLVTCRNYRRC